jgi:hypothetical protein
MMLNKLKVSLLRAWDWARGRSTIPQKKEPEAPLNIKEPKKKPSKRTPCIYGCGAMLQDQVICRNCHRKDVRRMAKLKRRVAPSGAHHTRSRS